MRRTASLSTDTPEPLLRACDGEASGLHVKVPERMTLGRLGLPLLAAGVSLVVGSANVPAAVPTFLTHQGRLFDDGGQPISASQLVIYRVYDAATDGSVLWTETLPVSFDNGYFSVELGTMTPLTNDLLAGGPRFLAIQVGADDEMTPREPLGSVPYARLASDVSGDIHPTSVAVNGVTV